jgi:hypothetical protein
MCIRSRGSCFCCFFYLKFSREYSKCVLEVEEAVSDPGELEIKETTETASSTSNTHLLYTLENLR